MVQRTCGDAACSCVSLGRVSIGVMQPQAELGMMMLKKLHLRSCMAGTIKLHLHPALCDFIGICKSRHIYNHEQGSRGNKSNILRVKQHSNERVWT